MVMEASPSPQSVGREFVRQYYTLLNKAPAYLHRFYNNYSSFVHGGLDAPNRETLPVVGQKQIHNRIQQLNFRDCHAKISQVDSQATLGNGVVVQVTGELSNGGAPMRRFTQTFVLAAQSPKKYYVHNDIFRYQDIVFSDEEGEGSGRSDGEEEEAGPGAVAGGYFPQPAFPPAFPAPPMPPIAAGAARCSRRLPAALLDVPAAPRSASSVPQRILLQITSPPGSISMLICNYLYKLLCVIL
ncbi:Ras GTPase-activating protein-binding protein 2 [Papilio machaon]|uniref:Ras GTPase-activating protein-binding protein 2 n=1 Tax=Papilio machaon TaxID=76193 RepID=A0A0N1IQE0_PAPMA|nr:Ras GTPase-activating protein-binding protein 2 [Papilio machaon]